MSTSWVHRVVLTAHSYPVREARCFRLSRDARAQAKELSGRFDEGGIDHAVSGPAGAARLAPFVTAVPVTDVWVTETVALDVAAATAGAEVVPDGHNVILRQGPRDEALVFSTRVEGVSTVNPFRLFYDLRQDPRRGREQADHLRKEVIGF